MNSMTANVTGQHFYAPAAHSQWELAAMAAQPLWFQFGVAVMLGLLVGSFLNVVVHRLPRMMERAEANY
ncbi:hypothetical protein ABTD78_24195, partial [Acinetobacter baumannii]